MSDDVAALVERIAELEETVAMLVGELHERKPGFTDDARRFWIAGGGSVGGRHFVRTR